ncbi:Tetratricopeptide repeat-containing protein [Duganella sp. CF402]|uniref:tetratricopeptide repeat protein n=1 Tax=unclassified Duganella TaxID=2636909 RepID=UPI0008BA1E7C|nr:MULTISPECIES: tetratricopeptide repeat protein [unclassified Duganella]RZT06053.1 tetratricopeptide repeat protein [Duganella sp. BK701]SEM77835.1 Tetratricopeptide repeat-containing protein [Duganella sp. CF402]
MKNAFAIVTLSALMSACAVAPQKPAEPAEPAAAAPQPAPADAEAAAPVVAEAPAPEVLPNVELTGDLLYRITKAELEFKQGQWQGPYITMMALAQQTRDPRLARRAAEMALIAKQPEEGMSAIRLWRSLAPDSDEAMQYFLGFAVTADDLSEAEAVFEQRLKNAPPAARPLAMFQMQQYLLRAKDKAAAFALTQRVLLPYDGTLEAHLILAQGAFSLNDTARARDEAGKALAIKPDSELAILTKAQVAGDIEAAMKLLTGFLQQYPNAREVRAAYARILVDNKQFDEARKQFLLLLKDQPDNIATLYALGVMSMQSSDLPEAEKYFSRFVAALEEHPNDERDPSKALLILSQIAEQRNDLDAAYNWLEKIDGSDEKVYLAARMKMAVLLARKGNVDQGRELLAELKPADAADQAQVFQTDAQLLRDAGDHRAAYVVLDNAVKRYPDNPDLLYDYALVAEKLGQVELMEKALRQVMIAAPDNQHAYNALGYSLAERNERLPEAYTLIDKALQMAPGDPFIMDSMGWVQYRMGKLEEAESFLRRAYALRNDPEIAVHLGEVLFAKGDVAGAQKMWKEAQAKDPKNDALKSTLARLNQSI